MLEKELATCRFVTMPKLNRIKLLDLFVLFRVDGVYPWLIYADLSFQNNNNNNNYAILSA